MNDKSDMTLLEALNIFYCHLDDESISLSKKVEAIRRISEMETMNSIKKDDLKTALRFLFDHFDFDVPEETT